MTGSDAVIKTALQIKFNMNTLVIDTSLGLASVSVLQKDEVIAFSFEEERTKQAEKLFEHIDICLNKAGISYSDINFLACSNGPGSFTGIRIGMAAALGINVGKNIPLIPVSTLESLAHKAFNELGINEVDILIDAGRKEFYYQGFNKNNKSSTLVKPEPATIKYDEYLKFCNSGNIIANKDKDFFGNEVKILSLNARDVGLAANYKINNQIDFGEFAPLYIRKPDAVVGNKYKYLKEVISSPL